MAAIPKDNVLRRGWLCFAAFSFAWTALAPAMQEGVALAPTNVIRLFNGKDLTNFTTWLVDTRHDDPRQVFSVTNGWIRISGDGLGYLSSRDRYRDYRLVAEFKWGRRNYPWGDRVGKARDSGIFLHSIGPDGNSHDGGGAFKAALECNLFQGAVGDFLLIRGTNSDGTLLAPRVTVEVAEQRDAEGWYQWLKGGRRQSLERWGRVNRLGKDPAWRDVTDFRGRNEIERLPEKWNWIECLAYGDHVRVVLNGTLVNEAFQVWPQEGRILLQCEGSEIFFRRLELHPRPRTQ